MDITPRLLIPLDNEQGLIGFTFDPEHATNNYFYVHYTYVNGSGSHRVARYTFINDTAADYDSELILLEWDHPTFTNHNGGCLLFSPGDGRNLYITSGDGGSGGDPPNNAQNTSLLLGKILRIDVSNSNIAQPYAIPPTNPFADGQHGAPEIFAYGMRNPFRASFDPHPPYDLWVGDVGQDLWEEIDIISVGDNGGWRILEAFQCYNSPTCNSTGTRLPQWQYPHDDTECATAAVQFVDCGGNFAGHAVMGGILYRGVSVAALTNMYVFGDYQDSRVWAFNPLTNRTLFLGTVHLLTGFALTEGGDQFIMFTQDGNIFQFPTNFIPEQGFSTSAQETTGTGTEFVDGKSSAASLVQDVIPAGLSSLFSSAIL